MDEPIQDKLAMFQAVKAVCDAKPSVWRHSAAFEAAYTDFCECIKNIVHLQPAIGVFNSAAKGIAIEMEVAERILTVEMDELIEHFEAVDITFVDDYTAARSMEIHVEMVR